MKVVIQYSTSKQLTTRIPIYYSHFPSSGKFRVCIDPSQTVNKAIHRPKHSMPTLNEQLHKLRSAKWFPLVDIKGFLQIPLDEESSRITTMHTSHGRYRLFGLPFGITSAPDEFHTRLTSALEGSNAIIRIADDIRVYGERNKLRGHPGRP